MTKKGKKSGWQTFENPPPIGEWVDVYCEDDNGLWRIDLGEWTGASLGSVNNPWEALQTKPILWRIRQPKPLIPLVEKAKMLPAVQTEPDEWTSEKSTPWSEEQQCYELP
jgi:hypothetical protein